MSSKAALDQPCINDDSRNRDSANVHLGLPVCSSAARAEAAEATKKANEGPLSTPESPSPEAVANYKRAGELIDQQRLAEAEEERAKSVRNTARDERKKTTTPTEEDERVGRALYEKWRALNPPRS